MSSLFKISDTEKEFLYFDTYVSQSDKNYILDSWKKIKEEHTNWDRMDCMLELCENYLPKYGLQAEYLHNEDMFLN